MEKEIINKILSKMENELSNAQLKKLEYVLFEIQSENNITNQSKRKINLIKQFINTKRIEGCSKRTEEYYYSTLIFFSPDPNRISGLP